MDAKTQAPKGLNAVYKRMSYRPLQPDAGVQPVGAYHCTGETHPVLKNYSCLLRVDSDRSKHSGKLDEPLERLPNLFRFSPEMIGKPIMTAGMPQVLCDETVSTLRAAPEGFLWGSAQSRTPVTGQQPSIADSLLAPVSVV